MDKKHKTIIERIGELEKEIIVNEKAIVGFNLEINKITQLANEEINKISGLRQIEKTSIILKHGGILELKKLEES